VIADAIDQAAHRPGDGGHSVALSGLLERAPEIAAASAAAVVVPLGVLVWIDDAGALVARHDVWIFGVRFLSLDYRIEACDSSSPS